MTYSAVVHYPYHVAVMWKQHEKGQDQDTLGKFVESQVMEPNCSIDNAQEYENRRGLGYLGCMYLVHIWDFDKTFGLENQSKPAKQIIDSFIYMYALSAHYLLDINENRHSA